MQNVAILGATGSIGTSTLDVLSRHADKFQVHTVTADQNVEKLAAIAARFNAKLAITADQRRLEDLKLSLKKAGSQARALAGERAIAQAAADPDCPIVVGAIVGAAGIASSFAAAQSGKRLLLANKESVVCGGSLLMRVAKEAGSTILPVDSEHNAIFQSLAGASPAIREQARIVLTASGGPFRTRQDLSEVTVEQACKHPNWSMGRKITIDSATLMNKGLEVIEARWLFDIPAERIEVVVHPQSVIHSMVRYADGSVIAQLGNPDMRCAIAYCLGWPDRIASGVGALDFLKLAPLTFEAPDLKRFPQLGYAYEALKMGGASSIVLNAANEIAVAAFLDRRIGFTDIAKVCRTMLYGYQPEAATDLEGILAIDQEARALASEWIDGYAGGGA